MATIQLEDGRIVEIKEKLKRNEDGTLTIDGVPYPKCGYQLIREERERQIEKEGWTVEHDDEHVNGQMIMAATLYAIEANAQVDDIVRDPHQEPVPYLWPWDNSWWKPSKDPIRNLEKAGALIAAEIDRLNRLT
jgi:hypothetical protein